MIKSIFEMTNEELNDGILLSHRHKRDTDKTSGNDYISLMNSDGFGLGGFSKSASLESLKVLKKLVDHELAFLEETNAN